MKRSSIAVIAASLLALSPIAASGAFAQQTDMKMVENEVIGDLAQIGVNDVDVTTLTLKQLQEIKLAVASGDSVSNKKSAVQAIVERIPGSQAD